MITLRKTAAFFMALCVTAVSLISGMCLTASAETEGYYTYDIWDNTAKIADVDESISGNVIIPSTLGGYPVTEIYGSAFNYCTSLTGVTIPNSVKTIGSYAFEGCTNLSSVKLPDSLENLEVGILRDTAYYDNSANWQGGVLYAGNYVVGADKSYSGTVSIRAGTKLIAESAFSTAYGITKVIIPSGVTKINRSTFMLCGNLAEVVIPDTVVSIGIDAFSSCGLTSVVIPDSVTELGEGAFSGCQQLQTAKLPKNITLIDERMFYNCIKLNSITIPEKVEIICMDAFYNCIKLPSITIPKSVKTIEMTAFMQCRGLTSVTISEGVESIGYYSFGECYGLTEVTIPSSVVNLDMFTFDGCTGLTAINADTNNPNYTSIDGILYDKKAANLIKCPSGKTGNIEIPNTVKSIGRYAFYQCYSITGVSIPNSVESIETGAFANCVELEIKAASENIKDIGSNAFYNTAFYNNENNWQDGALYLGNCLLEVNSLEEGEYTVKDGTKTIAAFAFGEAYFVTGVTVPDSVESIGEGAFGWLYDYQYGRYFKENTFTVKGYSGSVTEKYANQDGFTFISLGTTSQIMKGDVNGDGIINSTDFMQVRRHFLGIFVIAAENQTAADVNGDGIINSTDFMQIRRHFLGLYVIK